MTQPLHPGDPERWIGSGTEHSHQVALFAALKQYEDVCPALKWAHAIPNGGSRGDQQSAKIVGGQLKAEGVKKGVCDVHWPYPQWGFHGLMVEMKRPGQLKATSPEQDEYIAYLREQGYWVDVCDNWAKAFVLFANYGKFVIEPSRGWMPPAHYLR